MKMQELFEQENQHSISQMHDTIGKYVNTNERSPGFDQTCTRILQTSELDKWTYTGRMYRAIIMPFEFVMHTVDTRIMLSRLHRAELQQTHSKFYSWSKSAQAMQRAIDGMLDSDEFYRGIPAFIVLEQDSRGIDVAVVLGEDYELPEEEEVIATQANNAHVIGFMYFEVFYPIDKMQQFISKVRTDYREGRS